VLQHLLSNAIKFTQEGSVRLSGRLEREGEPRLRIEVADTGVGIEPEVLPDMFELFRQADASHKRRFGGTGLGLTLSRHLVQGMGGHIGIESDGPGRGTRVWFTIPTAPAAGAGSEDAGTAANCSARTGDDPGIREAA
jgi:signal transduction histidine kinase